jgi:hypothetical protein
MFDVSKLLLEESRCSAGKKGRGIHIEPTFPVATRSFSKSFKSNLAGKGRDAAAMCPAPIKTDDSLSNNKV